MKLTALAIISWNSPGNLEDVQNKPTESLKLSSSIENYRVLCMLHLMVALT